MVRKLVTFVSVLLAFVLVAMNAPQSPAQSSRDTLAGNWSGTYFYPDGRRSVPFTFAFGSDGCSGRSTEPNTFGAAGVPQLFAYLQCESTSLSPGGTVVIIKQYDGTGGVSHEVVYKGIISEDLNSISGHWMIGSTTGAFSMNR
ncbi:MAG: hypothetical protein ACLPID_10925 [Beijerinckiaceae bacterium]